MGASSCIMAAHVDAFLAAQHAEAARLHGLSCTLVDLLAEIAAHRHHWQALTTRLIREKAALHAVNDRLREELRRYTARHVE